jgi:hypothetical protein
MSRFGNQIKINDGFIEKLRAWVSIWDRSRELEACPRVPVEVVVRWSDPIDIINRMPKQISLGPADWTVVSPTIRFYPSRESNKVLFEWMDAPILVPHGQFITWSG